jgi:ribosome recycling factor
MAEEARVAVRNVRREANEQIKVLQKGSKVTEDERDQALKQIQEDTDKYVAKIDELTAAKEKEILAV